MKNLYNKFVNNIKYTLAGLTALTAVSCGDLTVLLNSEKKDKTQAEYVDENYNTAGITITPDLTDIVQGTDIISTDGTDTVGTDTLFEGTDAVAGTDTYTPEPTIEPTVEPTVTPTVEPTVIPTETPTPEVIPTVEPTPEAVTIDDAVNNVCYRLNSDGSDILNLAVEFDASHNFDDIEIVAHIAGYQYPDQTLDIVDSFNIESGTHYIKNLALNTPEGLETDEYQVRFLFDSRIDVLSFYSEPVTLPGEISIDTCTGPTRDCEEDDGLFNDWKGDYFCQDEVEFNDFHSYILPNADDGDDLEMYLLNDEGTYGHFNYEGKPLFGGFLEDLSTIYHFDTDGDGTNDKFYVTGTEDGKSVVYDLNNENDGFCGPQNKEETITQLLVQDLENPEIYRNANNDYGNVITAMPIEAGSRFATGTPVLAIQYTDDDSVELCYEHTTNEQ